MPEQEIIPAQLSLEPIYAAIDADLRRFIARRVDDGAAVEDIVQDTYLRIHTHLSDLRDTTRLNSWVFQIARNAVADYYRRQPPTTTLLDSVAVTEEPEDDETIRLAHSLSQMIDCLPEKYREALRLVDLQGLTQQSAADRLGLSLSGAKSRVQRARVQLKALYLDCCHVEFDRTGHVLGFEPRCADCADPNYVTRRGGTRALNDN